MGLQHALPEFHQNFTRTSPEFHRNFTAISPEFPHNFARISNRSTFYKKDYPHLSLPRPAAHPVSKGRRLKQRRPFGRGAAELDRVMLHNDIVCYIIACYIT